MSKPTFQVSTTEGQTYTEGDNNPFKFGSPAARLEGADADGDFVILKYTGGLEVAIPEHRIQYVAEINTTS